MRAGRRPPRARWCVRARAGRPPGRRRQGPRESSRAVRPRTGIYSVRGNDRRVLPLAVLVVGGRLAPELAGKERAGKRRGDQHHAAGRPDPAWTGRVEEQPAERVPDAEEGIREADYER